MSALEPQELSRPVRVNEVGKGGLEFTVEADEAERAAIAGRLGVERVGALTAQVTVKRWRQTGARLTAHVNGTMTRRCVVSLDEFEAPIDEQFEARYADPDDEIAMAAPEEELVLDPESEEPPEILEGGAFDAGEAIVQHLVLGLDPYPRKPGVEFEEVRESPGKISPFAVLSGLKKGASPPEDKG